jgi:glucuronoarabinoxylan endo-1,4-beta-xylanase
MKRKLSVLLGLSLMLGACNKNSSHDPAPSGLSTSSVGQRTLATGTAAINASTVQQTIDGFGGASILQYIADLTSAQRTTAFSPTTGIGMSMLRVAVDTSSSAFAAEVPTINAAKSFGAKVIATAWYAPASMVSGDKVKTASYAAFAAHLKAFCTAVGGVTAISPINEPNDTGGAFLQDTAPDVANFVAQQGPNCGAPIMAPEPFNMSQSFITSYLSNTTAAANTSFVCGHIYGATPAVVSSGGKRVWMTEHYTNSSISGNDWPNAMTAAKEISDCMNVGWSAYVWWYIRRSYGPIDESGNITKLGYVMSQFARYVRPGYTKVSCNYNPSTGVFVTAYKSGTKLVVVIVNQNAATTFQSFTISGITVTGFNRFFTNSTTNIGSNSFAVTGGSFGINLTGSSVTTLVSE